MVCVRAELGCRLEALALDQLTVEVVYELLAVLTRRQTGIETGCLDFVSRSCFSANDRRLHDISLRVETAERRVLALRWLLSVHLDKHTVNFVRLDEPIQLDQAQLVEAYFVVARSTVGSQIVHLRLIEYAGKQRLTVGVDGRAMAMRLR